MNLDYNPWEIKNSSSNLGSFHHSHPICFLNLYWDNKYFDSDSDSRHLTCHEEKIDEKANESSDDEGYDGESDAETQAPGTFAFGTVTGRGSVTTVEAGGLRVASPAPVRQSVAAICFTFTPAILAQNQVSQLKKTTTINKNNQKQPETNTPHPQLTN